MPNNNAPGFSNNGYGKVTTAIGLSSDYGYSVSIQADGKILVAGYSLIGSGYDFALVRYNNDGSLDTSFDGDGKLTTLVGSSNDYGYSVTVQADDKILVAGKSSNGSNDDFALVRYNSDGSLDTSFSVDGKITTDIGSSTDSAQSVTVQADGKILVAGNSLVGSSYDFALVRYNSDGSLDTSFSGDGKVTTDFGSGSYDVGQSLSVQANGKILVAGYSNVGNDWDFALVRYNSDGSLDTSFSGDGKVTTPVSSIDYGASVTVQADGKILVAGKSSNGSNDDFALVRYNTDGSLDTSFDGDGKVISELGFSENAYSVTVQADGKILLAGYSYDSIRYAFALVRYNSDGSLDTSFDGDGKVTTNFGFTQDRGYSVTVQADGKIIVAGTSSNGSNDDFALVRYNSNGSLDGTFDPDTTLNGIASYTENGAAVVLDNSVQIFDTDLASQGHYQGASITLTRQGGANNQDQFSGSGNLSFSGGNAVLSGVTIGTVSNSNGTLKITFNSNATQSRVNEALSSLAYSSSSNNPPASLKIDWTFDDGNTGTQGTGGALTVVGSTTVTITPNNDAPVFTAFSSPVATGDEDNEAAITFADLQREGDEVDVDGIVKAFVVKAVSSGSLKIGATAATATPWDAAGNNTIDASHTAFWTPAANANGSLNAFTVVAKDNGGLESAGAIQARVDVAPQNDAPTFTAFAALVAAGDEDSSTAITFADLQSQGNEADEDGTVSAFVVTAVSSGSLKIGATAATATPWSAAGNNTIDAGHKAFWTPAANAYGTLNAFTVVAKDNGGLESAGAIQARVDVAAQNDAPTFTAFAAPVTAGDEDSPTEITFADLQSQGNEADEDGSVIAFVVTAVSSGSLKIGATAATATPWSAAGNNTIDAGHKAFWTPAANANGILNAFTVVAKDNSGLESAGAIQAKVDVSFNNIAPTFTAFAAPVAAGNEDSPTAITFADLQSQGNEADEDGSVTAFVVKAVSSGSLKIGVSAATATPWSAAGNNTIDASNKAFWTPAANANGTLNAFTAVAMDNGGLESTGAIQARVEVAPSNDAPAFTAFAAPVAAGDEDSSTVITFADLQSQGNEA
ncbi:MAG: hypothetical protein ACXWTS_06915, partial [Methylococcaceae bacterium]